MARKFIFIDESGDPGFPGHSKNFTINILLASSDDLMKIEGLIAQYRFFLGKNQELKKVGFKEEKIKMVLKKVSMSYGFFMSCTANKKEYQEFITKSPLYFRNFVLKKSLENLFKEQGGFKDSDQYELIIDRYLDRELDREKLRRYLFGNYNLPNFLDIVQIDSRYCNGLQLLDVMSHAQKKKEFDLFECTHSFLP